MDDEKSGNRLFLIGSVASKAMSPALWNPVLGQLGCRWTYQPWDVPAGGDMAEVRSRLLEPDVIAANVTMPHKQWAAQTADSMTEAVSASGASNMLVRLGGRLAAHNTDVTAFSKLVGFRHQRHVLMLGAGGAARAALVALRGRTGKVTITDRDVTSSRQLFTLARNLDMEAEVVTWDQAQHQAHQVSLVVNATPLGKSANDGPAWGPAPLATDAFVYDFVYASHVTASIASARKQGLQAADGWDHLREQAAAMIPILGLEQRTDKLLQQALGGIKATA